MNTVGLLPSKYACIKAFLRNNIVCSKTMQHFNSGKRLVINQLRLFLCKRVHDTKYQRGWGNDVIKKQDKFRFQYLRNIIWEA